MSERADKLLARICLWSGPLNHTHVAEMIESAMAEAVSEEREACTKIAASRIADAEHDPSEYGQGYTSAATSIRMAIERRKR